MGIVRQKLKTVPVFFPLNLRIIVRTRKNNLDPLVEYHSQKKRLCHSKCVTPKANKPPLYFLNRMYSTFRLNLNIG